MNWPAETGKPAVQMTVLRAKAAICEILAQLEVDEGANVESLSLTGLDITMMHHKSQRVLMDVSIEMRRAPSHSWAIAGVAS